MKIKCPVCGNERQATKDEIRAMEYNHMMDCPFTLVTCGAYRKRDRGEDKWTYEMQKKLECCLGQIQLENFIEEAQA